mmetsp:Transcript_4505/g.7227  ORF Transcript_4505/g.7227 Transcript_4505/m.7227 type:complete len:113 (-) Transcript_4505:224-562(-)
MEGESNKNTLKIYNYSKDHIVNQILDLVTEELLLTINYSNKSEKTTSLSKHNLYFEKYTFGMDYNKILNNFRLTKFRLSLTVEGERRIIELYHNNEKYKRIYFAGTITQNFS